MSEEIKVEKIRKVFLDDLPRYGKRVDWKKSSNQHCKVRFIYYDIEGEIEIVDYNSKTREISLKYLDKPIYIMRCADFLYCKIGILLGTYNGNFRIEIGQIFKDDKRDMVITDREYRRDNNNQNRKWYKYDCRTCKWTEGWIEEWDLLNNIGCSCCYGRTVVEGINDITTTAPFMIPYFQGGYEEAKLYTRTSSKRIKPTCPLCGKAKSKSSSIANVYAQHSIGCPCSSEGVSYSEKLMFSVLNQLELNFTPEYSPNWIKPRRYDFYIPSLNLIIEMDGGLGHGKKTHCKSNMTKEESLDIDNYKDEMAREHGIEVIRIDCGYSKSKQSSLAYVKNSIVNSRLNILLDLSKIDWLKCEQLALSNFVKQACDLWDSGMESTTEIAKIIKVSTSTIGRYLKQGKLVSWCEYDAKKESKKVLDKGRELNKKKVRVFKDGTPLGVFNSLTDLEKQSKNKYGINLDRHYVAYVCNGEREEYHGYTFKYVEEFQST